MFLRGEIFWNLVWPQTWRTRWMRPIIRTCIYGISMALRIGNLFIDGIPFLCQNVNTCHVQIVSTRPSIIILIRINQVNYHRKKFFLIFLAFCDLTILFKINNSRCRRFSIAKLNWFLLSNGKIIIRRRLLHFSVVLRIEKVPGIIDQFFRKFNINDWKWTQKYAMNLFNY